MSFRPPRGVRLCHLNEIPDPGAKGFRFREGDQVFAGFVVRKGDLLTGYVDSCPHVGWPLAFRGDDYLTREADRILCAGHGALFRLEDGECVAGPCIGAALEPWPVKVTWLKAVVTA